MYRTNRICDKNAKSSKDSSKSNLRLRSASPKNIKSALKSAKTSSKAISGHFVKSGRSTCTGIAPIKPSAGRSVKKVTVKTRQGRSNSAKRAHSIPVRSPRKQKKMQGNTLGLKHLGFVKQAEILFLDFLNAKRSTTTGRDGSQPPKKRELLHTAILAQPIGKTSPRIFGVLTRSTSRVHTR